MRLGEHTYSSSRAVQRNPILVEIVLNDGAAIRAKVFVPMQGRISDVINRDLGAFNDMLRRANLPNIVSQANRRPSSQ